MRHSLRTQLLVIGAALFALAAGSSALQIARLQRIETATNQLQATYDMSEDDASRLREEVVRLVARVKDVWLRGGKIDSIDTEAATAEASWQEVASLRQRLGSDLPSDAEMQRQLAIFDGYLADYRASYVQTLAAFRVERDQPDADNADVRADIALKGKGLLASNALGDLQDQLRRGTIGLRAQQRAGIAAARNAVLGKTAALLLVLAIIGIWLVRSIARGIGEVASAAIAIGRGARGVSVPIRGSGEIAQLGGAFNRMIGDLALQEQQLEELRRIAVSLTRATTNEEACEIVVSRLAERFGYQYVSIYLLRPDDPENLHLISQRGYRTVIDPIPVANTVTGRAVRERRPILVTDAHIDREFLAAESQIICEACAPILTPDRVLGTLLLEEAAIDSLTETDLNLITTLANNLSVALENVRLNIEARGQIEKLASANREMHRLNAELARANALKSEFLATMSHELRTPLNAIIGFSELLADEVVSDPAETHACLMDILNSGRHLLSLINDVLDISKIEAGRMELKREALDLRHEVAEVIRGLMPLVAAHLHALVVDNAISAPLMVYADRQRVRQIVLNLLSNAIKFTPDGGTIAVGVTVGGRQSGVGKDLLLTADSRLPTPDSELSYAHITVRDTGIGIKDEDIPKLFEKFRQLDSSHTRQYEGTGLGLALTKQLVELNGGTIAVSSVFGVGSAFSFTLPLMENEPSATRGRLPAIPHGR